MGTTTNQSGYGNANMGGGPWNGPWPGNSYGTSPWQHPDWGYRQWLYASKPLWIVATVLGLIFFWPLGLVLVALMIGCRRMGCMGYGRWGGPQGNWQGSGAPPWAGAPWGAWRNFWCSGGRADRQAPPSSGNRAFDEYRAETLRRLEEEQKEFGAYLDRLRFAKDKAEFDQFMSELRNRPPAPPSDQPGGGPTG